VCVTDGGKLYFHNNSPIGNHHGYTSEKYLQVFWKFLTTSITWVHCDEVSAFVDKPQWLCCTWEIEVLGALLLCLSDCIYLLGNHREGWEGDTVELIEATPQSTLAETLEDLGHILVLVLIGAVVDNDENTECTSKILDSLCLTSSCWSSWSTTIEHTECL